jgi:ATP-dependent Lon protease
LRNASTRPRARHLADVDANLARELEILQLRTKIASEAQSEMDKAQREYVLRQQMRAIQKELGEDEGGEAAEAELLRERLAKAELPEEVRTEAERELKRLERLPAAAPDYHVIRTYLEYVLELPWLKSSTDKLDLAEARKILDEDHYGLEDVKERILEFLAVIKLRPDTKSPILLFVGPPGVGKTSLGRSIARALGRQFERMSLGGVRDEAELRGHRRTYIGSMPGRIIQSIRRAGVNNPVLMLDEIDKLGNDFRGRKTPSDGRNPPPRDPNEHPKTNPTVPPGASGGQGPLSPLLFWLLSPLLPDHDQPPKM